VVTNLLTLKGRLGAVPIVMPILGNLSEFPLPEVLLLIGTRTGRLRLLDVPEFGIMDIDFSNGEVQAMHLGAQTFTVAEEMVAKLSAVVQSQAGMFEFNLQPVASIQRERPLMVNSLVMSLVCHVDEQLVRQQLAMSPKHWYILEPCAPDVWIEPELNAFFIQSRSHLASGVYLKDLARLMGLEVAQVHQSLTNLRLLGLIRLVDGMESPVDPIQVEVEEKVSRRSNDFLRAQRATSVISKITSRLPEVTVKKLS
jgi:hypothetical protein